MEIYTFFKLKRGKFYRQSLFYLSMYLWVQNLEYCRINDDELHELINYDWPVLDKLNLSHNYITDIGISYLVHKKWSNLKNIELGKFYFKKVENKISLIGISKLIYTVK